MTRFSFVWVFWLVGTGESACVLTQPNDHPTQEPTRNCVVAFSQHKSAGSTIFHTIQKATPVIFTKPVGEICSIMCDVATMKWNGTSAHAHCENGNHKALSRIERFQFNGLVLSSANLPWWSPKSCVWVTFFSEPVKRLTSALYYCRGHDIDPLCGDRTKPWFDQHSVLDMASYWGNYGFRDFLWHPSIDIEIGNVSIPKPAHAECHKRHFDCLWQSRQAYLAGGDDGRTEAGKKNLKAVLQLLNSDIFDAIGILERFQDSMSLLDQVLPLRGSTWAKQASLNRVSHGSDAYKQLELEDVARARNDPRILEIISADTTIYNHAFTLFEQQLQYYEIASTT